MAKTLDQHCMMAFVAWFVMIPDSCHAMDTCRLDGVAAALLENKSWMSLRGWDE